MASTASLLTGSAASAGSSGAKKRTRALVGGAEQAGDGTAFLPDSGSAADGGGLSLQPDGSRSRLPPDDGEDRLSPLEDILREMNKLRQGARETAPDWSWVLSTFPDVPAERVERMPIIVNILSTLRRALPNTTIMDPRGTLLSLAASSGTGKSYLLQLLAQLSWEGFHGCHLHGSLAAWAKTVVFMGVNFNSNFQITTAEVRLLEKGRLTLKHLSILRLVFLELADLSDALLTFKSFVKKVAYALKKKDTSGDAIFMEGQRLVLERAGRGPRTAPVVLLVDEVARVVTLPIWRHLKAAIRGMDAETGAMSMACGAVYRLLAGTYELTDGAGGLVVASTLDYQTAAQAGTLSGRGVQSVDGLFVSHPVQLKSILARGLADLARSGFLIIRDAHSSVKLYESLSTDLCVKPVDSTPSTLSAESQDALGEAATGLSFVAGGHMRTTVRLASVLAAAGEHCSPQVRFVSIIALLRMVEMDATSEQAQWAWSVAAHEDVTEVLSNAFLNRTVHHRNAVFARTRKRFSVEARNAKADERLAVKRVKAAAKRAKSAAKRAKAAAKLLKGVTKRAKAAAKRDKGKEATRSVEAKRAIEAEAQRLESSAAKRAAKAMAKSDAKATAKSAELNATAQTARAVAMLDKLPTNWDEARYMSLVSGSGKDYVPRIPPLVLLQLLNIDSVQGCTLYKPLKKMMQQTESTPDQRWEQVGCDLELLLSRCRSEQATANNNVTLHALLQGQHSAYAGGGRLLRNVRVDASHPRKSCIRSELHLLLAKAGRDDDYLLDYVHRLAPNTTTLDAVFFYRVTEDANDGALIGRLVMVGVQFKHSHEGTSSIVRPEHVFRDWDNLRTALGKHYEEWMPRFVYINLSDRRAGAFQDQLRKRAGNKNIPARCAEHSIVRGRQHLERCMGPTVYHFIRSMDWLFKSQVTEVV